MTGLEEHFEIYCFISPVVLRLENFTRAIEKACLQGRLWISEVVNRSQKHADIGLQAGIFMNNLLRFLTLSLAILLTAAWERIQKKNGQSLKTETKYEGMQDIENSLQIVVKKPIQGGIKVLRAVQNLSKFTFFLRSSCFLENVMYEFQAKDELSKLTEVPLGYGWFHELSKRLLLGERSPSKGLSIQDHVNPVKPPRVSD